MPQDYDKFGIYDVIEKQALFKVIKSLNADDLTLPLSPEPSASNVSQANSSPEPLARYGIEADPEGDDLLDLDGSEDDDDDFLQTFSDAFAKTITPQRLAARGTPLTASAAASTTNPAAVEAAEPSVGTPLPLFLNNNNNTSAPSYVSPTGTGGSGGSGSGVSAPLGRTQSTAASTGLAQQAAQQQQQTEDAALEDAAALAAIADPPRIRVIVRKRPLNRKEIERGDNDVLQCDSPNATLYVHEPKTKVDMTRYIESHAFCFDDVFDDTVDNDQVYQRAVRPLIATLFRAGKGTCFAYGQTGSGKTFTMGPLPLRAAADIFSVIEAAPEYSTLSLHVACYEIYGGKVFDLLNNRQRLDVREDAKRRVQVVGLKEIEVKTLDVLMKLCEHSAGSRSTGQTGANDESSRSHSIMVFALRAPAPELPTGPGIPPRMKVTRPGQDPDAPILRTVGKLTFIDLAGSERGADTYDNDKQTRLEGAEINKSLLALKECIRALDAEARHIPFRGSKLTEVLRDSFIGKNARTVMIANVSPNSTSCEHTINTLRYADRVKEIKKDSAAQQQQQQQQQQNGGVRTTTTAAAAQPTASEGAVAVAALLHKLPPPNLPTSTANGGITQQQQQQQQQQIPVASAAPLPLPPVEINNNNNTRRGGGGGGGRGAPVSPTKQRNNSVAAIPPAQSQPPVALTTKINGGSGSGNAATATGRTVAAAVTPAVATPSSRLGGGGGGGRTAAVAAMNTPSPPTSTLNDAHVAAGGGGPSRRSVGGGTVSAALTAHPLKHALSDASQNSAARSQISEIDDALLDPLLAAEEELITAHRSHIEITMASVREEMELLSQLDDSTGHGATVESYIEELSNILVEKAAAVSTLQQQLTAFRKQLRAAAQAAAAAAVSK